MLPAPARFAAILAFALLLLVASVAGGADRATQLQPQIAGEDVPETDTTITRIALAPDGNATWTLQIRTRLEDDSAVTEYEAFQERFRANRSQFVAAFGQSVTGIVENAERSTGREMAADGVTAGTSIQTVPRRWGIVTYRFRWAGFAAVDGDRIVVGDVFEGGFFIAEGDVLEVVAPTGYRIEAAAPTPDESVNDTVAWEGRVDFADRRPRVVAAPAATTAGVTTGGEAGEGLPLGWGAAAGLIVALLVVAGLGYRRFRGRAGSTPEASTSGPRSAAAGGPVLADEDYVIRALEESGGRMKQAELADVLEWSSSKTSRVLGRMEEAGTIRKLQLGRENVIDLEDGS